MMILMKTDVGLEIEWDGAMRLYVRVSHCDKVILQLMAPSYFTSPNLPFILNEVSVAHLS